MYLVSLTNKTQLSYSFSSSLHEEPTRFCSSSLGPRRSAVLHLVFIHAAGAYQQQSLATKLLECRAIMLERIFDTTYTFFFFIIILFSYTYFFFYYTSTCDPLHRIISSQKTTLRITEAQNN